MKEAIYELKQDIRLPGAYIRAGERKSKAQWEASFPNAFRWGENDWKEWFIDLSEGKKIISASPTIIEIVNTVFERRNLHSLSYKDAAIECIAEYKKIFKRKP